MKMNKLALTLLIGLGTGCTMDPPAPDISMSELPNCFDSNYDKRLNLFTMINGGLNQENQQCLLTVVSGEHAAPASQLTAGSYQVLLSGGGDGGAGGTMQIFGREGGGGGGGGASGFEQRATVYLFEGVYKLTIGAGGPGGHACAGPTLGGGAGWAGSPSNIVRVVNGEVVMGMYGADFYRRPTRAENERNAGKFDGHGGHGPGRASGGNGGSETKDGIRVEAQPGLSKGQTMAVALGGAAGSDPIDNNRSGGGGGGGASSLAQGGKGGGEIATFSGGGATLVASGRLGGGAGPGGGTTHQLLEVAPERGGLGSGGGGGQGSSFSCSPGAPGGHGFVVFRPD